MWTNVDLNKLSKYTDDIIALGIIFSGIAMIFLKVPVPEWFVIIIGMVATHFFKKPGVK